MTDYHLTGGRTLDRPRPESLHWGIIEICSSCGYILLALLLIVAVAVGVLALIGFGSLEQVYGFNQIAT